MRSVTQKNEGLLGLRKFSIIRLTFMKHKPVQFHSKQQEHDFWAKTDVADVFDTNTALINPKMPKLKPSTDMISIRLPKAMVDDLKTLANKRDVPYQSLLKVFLAEKIRDSFIMRQ